MQSKTLLDYRFVVSSNAYVVRALLKLEGQAHASGSRVPLNLSVVLDRSGSMGGAKLVYARRAAADVVRRLHPEDVLSVVTYDDNVHVLAEPSTAAGQSDLAARIVGIETGGSTNLSGGWMRGRELVARNRTDHSSSRVLLLTDGLANVGITNHDQLVGLCRAARDQGIKTTTIGFGADYDEQLLRAMADAGGGHTYYIETPDQAPGVFAEELEGLLTLAAQNVSVEVRPSAATRLAAIHHSYPRRDLPGGCALDLGDLYAREPKMVLLEFLVSNPSAESVVDIAEVRIEADVLTSGGGVEHQQIVLALRTPLSQEGHTEPEIHREQLLLDAAVAREQALEASRRRDFATGREKLAAMVARLETEGRADDADVQKELRDLTGLVGKFATRDVSMADRKYMYHRSHDALRAKRLAMARYARERNEPLHDQPEPIRYLEGDATRPAGSGLKIIAHLCSDDGSWPGDGFAGWVGRRWPEPERLYLEWASGRTHGTPEFRLGAVQIVPVNAQTWVANMVAKSSAAGAPAAGRPFVDYGALETALIELSEEAVRIGASVHMPRIGCAASGGDWSRIAPLIERHLGDRGIPVAVYDLVTTTHQ